MKLNKTKTKQIKKWKQRNVFVIPTNPPKICISNHKRFIYLIGFWRQIYCIREYTPYKFSKVVSTATWSTNNKGNILHARFHSLLQSIHPYTRWPIFCCSQKVVSILSQVQESCSPDEARLLDKVMEFLKREGLYSPQVKDMRTDDPVATDLIGALLTVNNA